MRDHVHTNFSAAIFSELPHLRAYARLMTNDPYKADREVEETLKHAICIMDQMSGRAGLRVQLLAILRRSLIAIERMHCMVPSAMYEKLNSPFRIGNGYSKGSIGPASALLYLDYEDREAVVLTAGMRLSSLEAANMCGCEVGVYAARLRRGQAQLTELLPEKWNGSLLSEPIVGEVFAPMKAAGEFEKAALHQL
jgi:DNA-directed RNA polymerase specialized sigma24 family protein